MNAIIDPEEEKYAQALERLREKNEEARRRALNDVVQWPPDGHDMALFDAHGFKIAVCRQDVPGLGEVWTGYVCLPEGHPDYRKHYHDIDVDAPGGLTFCQLSYAGFWVGFDLGHANDMDIGRHGVSMKKRTIKEVRKMCDDLALQFANRAKAKAIT